MYVEASASRAWDEKEWLLGNTTMFLLPLDMILKKFYMLFILLYLTNYLLRKFFRKKERNEKKRCVTSNKYIKRDKAEVAADGYSHCKRKYNNLISDKENSIFLQERHSLRFPKCLNPAYLAHKKYVTREKFLTKVKPKKVITRKRCL